jgi:hypothetical protein
MGASRPKRNPKVNFILFLVDENPCATDQRWLLKRLTRDGARLLRLGVAVDLGPNPTGGAVRR